MFMVIGAVALVFVILRPFSCLDALIDISVTVRAVVVRILSISTRVVLRVVKILIVVATISAQQGQINTHK